jgi:WW domain-containing oxidoreductase
MVSLPSGPLELGVLSPPEAAYSRIRSYGIAKLANVWHAKALARRLADSGVCAVSLHPGAVATDIGRHLCCAACCFTVFSCFFRGVDSGAATSVYCCLAPEVAAASGGYFADAAASTPSANACDEALIARHEEISFEVLRGAGFAIDRV